MGPAGPDARILRAIRSDRVAHRVHYDAAMLKPFVVILAGGEGTRLAPLTRALYGIDLPKQFAVLAGEKSLLQQTIDRALALTTTDHILVVVSVQREQIARAQIAPYPGIELVVQPKNLDTGPGLLLPLSRILARGGKGRVVFLPSDHYVADDAPLAAGLRACEHGMLQDRLSLVGVAPTGPEVEYGWIVRGAPLGHSKGYSVARFAEKPAQHVADQLWRDGGLWNTFIQSGPIAAFWTLARRHLPRHTRAFEAHAAGNATVDEIYHDMPPANFSHDVLSHAEDLAVVPVANSGWSDWGSPRRVFASLAGTANHSRLVERMRGDTAVALAG